MLRSLCDFGWLNDKRKHEKEKEKKKKKKQTRRLTLHGSV